MKRRRNKAHSSPIKLLTLLCILLQCIIPTHALFGSKKRKREAELAAKRAAEEAARRAKLVVLFGMEFDKRIFYALSTTLAVVVGGWMVYKYHDFHKKKGNRPGKEGTLDVVVVGCGLPGKSMGWFHLTQLLEMRNVNVRAVVEPFFLNKQLNPHLPPSFETLVTSIGEMGVDVVPSIELLEKFQKPTMCLIAGRTHDNPELFRRCIGHGASVIFLEKPGAPTLQELQEMKDLAEGHGVKVYLGYNKNVTPYVQKAIGLSKQVDHSHVFFCHNNSYRPNDLPEVFTRNSEGMLKNMAIHELALLVTFFGVTVETIDTFKVNTNKLFSEKLTIWKPGTQMPNPEYITDFSRVAFKITTKNGTVVSVMADRCGGNVSFAVVKDEHGHEIEKFEFPSAEEQTRIDCLVQQNPDTMPYFFIQEEDYREMKHRVVTSVLEGRSADGVATIGIGIEAMKLAEFATEQLNRALKAE